MRKIIVYQTLEDRDNPDYILENGPFRCTSSAAWLGHGYYFWESHIENGHWWGDLAYQGKDYVICKASYDFDENLCFDLHDNPDHRIIYRDAIEYMKKKGAYNKSTTVSRVISFLRNKLKTFDFEATRVYGINSRRIDSKHSLTMPFKREGYQYLDLIPPIQICFYTKKSLNLREYQIIYPDMYNDDFAV